MKLLSLSIVLSAILIAAALAITNRYTLQVGSNTVWRLDQWTGETKLCLVSKERGCAGENFTETATGGTLPDDRSSGTSPADRSGHDGQILSFARNGNGSKYLLSGWSQAEDWGVWSDGPIATMQLTDTVLAGKSSAELVIEARGFVTQSQPTQRVRVRVNGADAGELLLGWDITSTTLQVPAEALKSSPLKIEMVPENPISPTTTGTSSDKRLLGVGLKSLQLSELKQEVKPNLVDPVESVPAQ
jgi:hypothetical protein